MTIPEIETWAAALGTVLATLIPLLKPLISMGKKTAEIQADLRGVNRDIQRLTMHDEDLPIRERIIAGELYIKLGGNGASAEYLAVLKERYRASVEEFLEKERHL